MAVTAKPQVEVYPPYEEDEEEDDEQQPVVPQGQPDVQPPVEGVQDDDAYALAQPPGLVNEDGTPMQVPLQREELRAVLELWRADQPPTEEELDAIIARLPEVLARGRAVAQTRPELRMGHGVNGPDVFDSPDDLARYVQRHEQEQQPDAVNADYHQQQPNPPFATVREGPAMPGTQQVRPGVRSGGPLLADYMEQHGIHPELADEYRKGPVAFGPIEGKGGAIVGLARGRGGIALANYLQGFSEPDVLAFAQHEAAHQRGPSNPPMDWRLFDEDLAQSDPGLLYLLRGTPAYRNQPGAEHDYTGPFDLGMTLAELPAALHPFYTDSQGRSLLSEHPFTAFLRGRGMMHGPFDTWGAR